MDTSPGVEALPQELVLGEWRVRPAEGVLQAPGRQIRLEPKVAALLAYLIRHRDRMVSKQELLSAVWPDAVVAPIALARAVSELRRALEDDRRAPRYIETYPKRGYRLVASSGAPSVAALPRRRRGALGIGAVAGALALLSIGSRVASEQRAPGPPVVVVAEFRSLSGDSEAARFAAGLTEDVLAQLARTGDLRVLEAAAGAAVPDAATTLEGSVRRADERTRIVARLVDRASGRPLWTETFDRVAGDPLQVQRDVAVRIVHGLRAHGLGPQRLAGAAADPPGVDVDPSAYDLFRRGRELLMRRDLKGALTGQEAFERALRLEPDFELGRTGLALALTMRSVLSGDPRYARQALEQARRAASADPNLPEARQAMGRALMALHRYDEALVAEEEALRLQPAYLMAIADRGELWLRRGRLDSAYAVAVDLDGRGYAPWRGMTRTAIGGLLLDFGHAAEARAWLESALYVEPQRQEASDELARLEALQGDRPAARRRLAAWVASDPSSRSSRLLLGELALLDGDLPEARVQADGAAALPGDPLPARLLQAAVAQRASESARARGLVREVEGLCNAALEDGSQWWGHAWSLAVAAAPPAPTAGAAAWYAKAVVAGRREPRWDRLTPYFEGARGHPGFQAALAQAEAAVSGQRPGGTPPRPPRLATSAARAAGREATGS